jgi:hypothetical protein
MPSTVSRKKKDLSRKETPPKNKNPIRIAVKFVSIVTIAVASNVEVNVSSEEFA